jgi:hypothetical protein
VRRAAKSRDQALNLIDFLSAYDAHRHPPARRVAYHGMFRLAQAALLVHPAVQVRPDEDTWLAVEFVDLPPVPVVLPQVADLLVDANAITATAEPQLIPPPEPATNGEPIELLTDAQRAEHTAPARAWIESTWRPWSAA